MNWLLSKDKDFLGKRSLSRQGCQRSDRKQLVGLLSEDATTVLPEGTRLIEDPDAPTPVPMCGHVTSSYFSASLAHPIETSKQSITWEHRATFTLIHILTCQHHQNASPVGSDVGGLPIPGQPMA